MVVANKLSLMTLSSVKEIEIIFVFLVIEATDHIIIVIRKLKGTIINFVTPGLGLWVLEK